MADNEYTSGLNILLGNRANTGQVQPQSPEKDIQDQYDSGMSGLESLIQGAPAGAVENTTLDRYALGQAASGMAADEYSKLDELSYGSAPQQQIVDPAEMISSPGQRVERGLKAGWGDLVKGTGDMVNFMNAWVKPGDPDPSTPIGEYLKKVGTEFQNENALILSEDLQDITFRDMLRGEFWNSKISRLVPYAMSFIVPYGVGASIGRGAAGMLGKWGAKTLKSVSKADKSRTFMGMPVGTMGKGVGMGSSGRQGSGLLGFIAKDLGKKGIAPTKKLRDLGGFVGGGFGANMAEGAYLSGEAYTEMLNETDENGNKLFTPDEAASHAAGVMGDNLKWVAVDALQYGVLFGGLGKNMARRLVSSPAQKEPFKLSVKGLTDFAVRKALPLMPAGAAYASVEGITEGIQETYQEWIKYTAIQEAKGEDYETLTDWVKDGDGVRPEIRDLFWSAVGLGAAMGGSRGFYDANAERQKMLDEKIDLLNNNAKMLDDAKTLDEQYEAEERMFDNVIGFNVWNYDGDGSISVEYINNLVKDGKRSQEWADGKIKDVEQLEKNFEKHSINSILTESGAKAAFFKETRKTKKLKEIEIEKAIYEKDKSIINETYENSKEREEKLAVLKENHSIVIKEKQEELDILKTELQDIYTLRMDKAPIAKKTGKRDARFKKQGLTKEQMQEYSQEAVAEKERLEKGDFTKEEREQKLYELAETDKSFKDWKADLEKEQGEGFLDQFDNKYVMDKLNPSIAKKTVDTVKELGTKAFETAKDLGGKAAEGVKGLFTKTKEVVTSEETKKEVKSNLDKAKNWVEKNLESSKEAISEVIEKAKKEGKTAKDVIKELRVGKKLKGATKQVYDAIEKFAAARIADKEGKTWPEFIKGMFTTPQEGVKKKDQKRIVPKTKDYQKQEESLQEGPRQIKKADISKGPGNTYIIKTPEGDIRYKDFEGASDKYVLGEDTDIELRLKKPIKGQENVVEVDGKLYFQFKKDASLYESEIEVVAKGEVIGKVAQQDYKAKGPTKRAKKADKRAIDKIIAGVKDTKENIKKLLSKSFKDHPQLEITQVNSNHNLYYESGSYASAKVEEIIQKKFPGKRGYVINKRLTDDYGNEVTAYAIGSVVLINEDSVNQSDIIHETGHIYYSVMKNTPLMKRIRKLLYKTKLYEDTKMEYPELILFNYKGDKVTLGNIYENILTEINRDENIAGDLKDIVIEMSDVQGVNDARFNELFNELRIQLKSKGYKESRVDLQEHLIEETFTRTLEAYSYGTADAVLKGSKAQQQLRKDLIEFYKESKKLATEEEARDLLTLSVDNVPTLSLEAAIKHVLLDFSSADRTSPKVENSGYAGGKRAKKSRKQKVTSRSAIYAYISNYTGRNLTDQQITDRVLKDIEKDGKLILEDSKIVEGYIKAVVTQKRRMQEFNNIGELFKTQEDEVDDNQTVDYDEETKNLGVSKSLSQFFRNIIKLHNAKNPDALMDKRDLMYNLMALAKESMNDPYTFYDRVRNHDNTNIQSMLRELDSQFKNDKALTNALLLQVQSPLEGINIETLSHGALQFFKDKYGNVKKRWKKHRTINKSVEGSAINTIMKDVKDNGNKVAQDIADVYNELFSKRNPDSLKDRYAAAQKILDIILDDSGKGKYVYKQALLQNRINFKGERDFLHNILFNYTKKFGTTILDNPSFMPFDKTKQKFIPAVKTQFGNILEPYAWIGDKQGELRAILTEGLIYSRPYNYLSMVDNVQQDGVSIFNKENSLHNRMKNIAEVVQNEITISENDIMHPDNNIYTSMLYKLKADGELANRKGEVFTNPFNLTINSGLMRRFIGEVKDPASLEMANTLNDLTPTELLAYDFFSFLSKYNEGIKNKKETITYDQPIAVFSDKSRRYYIESIIAHNDKNRKLLLSKIKNNPRYNATYKNGKDKVFPFTITNNKIEGIDGAVVKFKKYIKDNKELFQNNEDFNETKNVDAALEAYYTSYIANRFMAQQLFVADHIQTKDQIDYIKRAAGSIAGHTVYDRNIMVEPVIIKDYYKDGAIENDAMGYVLPNQAQAITSKYGVVQKVGSVFKFVYNYTEMEGKHKGKSTYLKFAVHVITPKMESENAHMKNIADVLRARQERVNKISGDPSNLVIAASESAAKMFVGDKNHIYDISPDNFNMDYINAQQDNLYMEGDAKSQMFKFKGLHGEGLGIQLELDKKSDERFFPSQLFYHTATNISNAQEQALVDEMFELRTDVMNINNKQRNEGLIPFNNDSVLKERDLFKSSITEDVYGNLITSMYEYTHPMYPYLNATHNSMATGRITHKGTKMYTKGAIGYQSSSLGYDLKAYEAGLYEGNEKVLASEAIVPEFLEKQGVKRGDVFIGTRVPAHGKVSSSVFIVKDFHDQVPGSASATSNITIPAEVSKNWGADLDGDSIHMNFKWKKGAELNPTKEQAKETNNWKTKSNRFIDAYIDLISRDKKAEITADINFEEDAKIAIKKSKDFYKKGQDKKSSQLTPLGDAKMFEDNVPAKHLVGIIASLQRTFNIMSNSQDALPFDITIKGVDKKVKTTETFNDNKEDKNDPGTWFGVAQLLNIALDNAKWQYAGQLGLDMQSVFSYTMLRRLGYSLNDLSVMFNDPIVKDYMEYKRSKSKNYISNDSEIKQLFEEKSDLFENEFLNFTKNKGIYANLNSIMQQKKIDINLNNLKNSNKKIVKTEQGKVLAMIYSLEKFNQHIINPFSKAFTVHQSIEKNPNELNKVNRAIKEASKPNTNIPLLGKKGIPYTLKDKTINNQIVDHATKLFDTILERASKTDIRYTPYMQDIIEHQDDPTYIPYTNIRQSPKVDSQIINQIIINDLKNNITVLNDGKSPKDLVIEFKDLLKRNPENEFLTKVLEIKTLKNGNDVVVLNSIETGDLVSQARIEEFREAFADLNTDDQNLIFKLEYQFNGFGLTGAYGSAQSFTPFFNKEYIEKINDWIQTIVDNNQTKEPSGTELSQAISDIKNKPQSYDARKGIEEASKNNNNFEIKLPGKKAKKRIYSETSYNNDHLGTGTARMTFENWNKDKGIDISKIDKNSKTYEMLFDRYNSYLHQLGLVRNMENNLLKKPLSKYSLEGLYDLARDLRKMDNTASKGLAYEVEKEIGQKAFKMQVEGFKKTRDREGFIGLKKAGLKQGYKYNVPGEDGVPQEDLSNFRAWLGSNNMTSKRPEIQYLINEAQKEYRKYLRSFKRYKNMIEGANNALIRSKMKGISVLERVRQGFDQNARYQYIYGNIATLEGGNIRLFTEEEIAENFDNLTQEERNYYNQYKAVAELLLGAQETNGTVVPGMQMGEIENMSRSGLFSLYDSMIDSSDYNRVLVYGTDKDGKRALKTFYEWKYDVYKGRTKKLRLDSGREILELDKLRTKAKQLKAKGKHEDGTDIMLSDAEYDALVNNGAMLKRMVGYEATGIDAELIQEYERRKGVKAQKITYDINTTLLEFARGSIFRHGENLNEIPDGFAGMGNLAILTDSIIAFNKNLDNKNAVNYLTRWWKEGFIERKQQQSRLGKSGDKVIDLFVRLTSLRLLGFNMTVATGNVLAGKYQELRKRGGKQFIKGEKRYWVDRKKSWKILRENRIIEYSFDDFVHLSEPKGVFGQIEKLSYIFMDKTEGYIQGAAFLGELTDQEYNTGNISEQRVMQINHKISTLHGEGYTALDQNMLAMYSYGRALLQFKKWFVTLIQDRFKAEDIDRFGEVNVGSYRAAGEFTVNLFKQFFKGELTMESIVNAYNNSSEKRQKEMKAYINGLGIGVTLLSLIAIMEDDDDTDQGTLRALKKLSNDVFVTTDLKRFVNYTMVPASLSTMKNTMRMMEESVRGDKIKRTGPYGEAGTSKALKTAKYDISPYASVRKSIANRLYTGPQEKKETSSLIR